MDKIENERISSGNLSVFFCFLNKHRRSKIVEWFLFPSTTQFIVSFHRNLVKLFEFKDKKKKNGISYIAHGKKSAL